MKSPPRFTPLLLVPLALCATACQRTPGPKPGTEAYEDVVSAFYTGVAALQTGDEERARAALDKVTELAPSEPAADANLAILALEQHRLDDAARRIDQARKGAPHDVRVLILSALIERERGDLDRAIQILGPATTGAAADPRARFLLAQMLEQRAGPGDVTASRGLLDSLVAADPSDLFVRLASARFAARHGETREMERDISRLALHAASWPPAARRQLARVVASVGNLEDAGQELTYLATSLEGLPAYGQERSALQISPQHPDLVLTELVALPTPSRRPPAADSSLAFTAHEIEAPPGTWRAVLPVWLRSQGTARIGLLGPGSFLLTADSAPAQQVELPTSRAAPDAPSAVAAFDFDHDFRMDLATASGGGFRVFHQDSNGIFRPVPGRALPSDVRTGAFTDIWAADTDVDGDVDLVLAPAHGTPFVLLNQGDGTFGEQHIFDDGDVTDARQFVWGDLDNDGDPDAVLLDDAGRLHAFRNPRHDRPRFAPWAMPDSLEPAAALALGDVDGDGTFDVVVLRRDGRILRSWWTSEGWRVQEIARWSGFGAAGATAAGPTGVAAAAGAGTRMGTGEVGAGARLFLADLDNNGALDVAASAGGRTRLWLGNSEHALVPQDTLPATVTAAADPTGAGRIVLYGLDDGGRPVRLTSRQSKDYYALTLSPRATSQDGDGRINTFGIGGEAEVRAGMLYEKRPITQPFVHFGIGENTGVTVARIIWPNGTAQADFDLLASQGEPIVATQRLKGSCPWLFAWNGKEMDFVTDAIWRTALGLRINTYGSSAVIHSEDWMKIRGDQLVPRDGYYDLRITAELWESHFFDHLDLMTVDHPAGTEVWVDERFILPPPPLRIYATGPLHALARATDDRGGDMTGRVRSLDERYVDSFGLTAWQGVAKEHSLVVDLGPDAPTDRPLMLVAQGWVYPTDGSINVAIGQGRHAPLHGIRVEVPDGSGGWRVLHADLGMPSGKTKTVLIDLKGAFRDGGSKRVRVSTNMEIYWDRIAWAVQRPDTPVRITRIPAQYADLHFRGLSRSHQAGRKAPDLPTYRVATTVQRWRDLEGYYTRYGDVRPLVDSTDDRYVIMNAGDELSLRFAAQPDPPTAWVRDYVLDADGWVKDGDLNDGWSRTLRPLPYHGLTDYSRAPGPLEEDPAYLLHPDDWRTYHTRYVTPRRFQHALSPSH